MLIYGMKVVFRVFTKLIILGLAGSSHNTLLFSPAA
jgi:hypothetical protein